MLQPSRLTKSEKFLPRCIYYAGRCGPVHMDIVFDQPSTLIGRSCRPGMTLDSCSTSASTTIHTTVPCRIVWFGLFGGHRLTLSRSRATPLFAIGPMKVPCRGIVASRSCFKRTSTRQHSERNCSYAHSARITEFGSAPSLLLVCRTFCHRLRYRKLIGIATVTRG